MDNQEEKHIAPLLHQLGKLDTRVPEGYLDELHDQVLQKVKVKSLSSGQSSQGSNRLVLWAAAAGIAVLIGFMMFGKDDNLSEEAFLAGYPSIEEYLIAEDEGELMEAYVESMPIDESSVEMDYLMEGDEEWIEDLYIEEI